MTKASVKLLLTYSICLLQVFNVCIGAFTPPVGAYLFVASSAGKIDLIRIVKASNPIVVFEIM